MFGIGWAELLVIVIAVVAIIVVGPKELPRLMRTFGHYVGKLRHMAADFQRQFEEAVRDSEIDEVRKAMQEFHAQASDINLRAPVDEPLMVPKPRAKTPEMASTKKTAAAGPLISPSRSPRRSPEHANPKSRRRDLAFVTRLFSTSLKSG